jgi:hypothetical protein
VSEQNSPCSGDSSGQGQYAQDKRNNILIALVELYYILEALLLKILVGYSIFDNTNAIARNLFDGLGFYIVLVFSL